jgi:hypothetical protein
MRALIASLFIVVAAAPAAAKSYTAERFDARIRLLPGGTIEVTETVTFRFEEGTFEHVYREISSRRTDGIEVVSAEMDGQRMPFGKKPGEVEVRRGSRLHIRWRFSPRSGTTHTFVLSYTVRGVVKREAGVDILEWVALPSSHAYRIDSSEVIVETPATFARPPVLETRHVNESGLERGDQRVQVLARGIGKNGWVKTRMEFAGGNVIADAPKWQQRQIFAAESAPLWLTAAGSVFLAGLVLMFALRQRYDSPGDSGDAPASLDAPPDTLRPGIAGALASNGGVSLQHAMATMFDLADRGAVTISEEPRKWGQRHFTLHRLQAPHTPTPEEAALLKLAFRKKDREEPSVSLSQARSRIASRLREFRNAVNQELDGVGLLDEERLRVRGRYLRVSFALLILAGLLVVPAILLTGVYQGWPFLVPGAVASVAVVGFIFYGALTPLSNEGVRRAGRWRAYQKYLKDVARDRVHLTVESPARLLPFAIALGLAGAWSKFVKKHPAGVPPWFRAVTATADDGGSFAAFIATGGAGADGGSAGTGGGAAGGGSSGAG